MSDLSAMDIYQELPQTDCGDCNFPTCMAFAMQLASKQVSLDQCPHVSSESEETLAASSAPPMRIVKIGDGSDDVEIGGETVQFRHEEKFYRPTAVSIEIDDSLEEPELEEKVNRVNDLQFERVGEKIGVDLVTLKNDELAPKNYGELVETVDDESQFPLYLRSRNPEAIKEGLTRLSGGKPLVGNATEDNWKEMANLAEEYETPLAVSGYDLSGLAELTDRISEEGAEELVLNPRADSISNYLEKLTKLRRLAVVEEFSPLGYPVLASVNSGAPFQQVADGTSHILKYASIISLDTTNSWQILPLLTVRQHIYIDPQVQNSVEAKLYEVGDPGPDSPVLFTTNFQLTYYSLEGEVDDSGFSAYISVMDTDGLGVLNAYADDQLTGEEIVETVKEQGVMDKVDHNKLIIPGLVGMLRMTVQEEGGWEVIVGPEDAASLPRFLRQKWEA
ncbi:acetyl-CoA decarbonylase/synthase complex subunit gamma [Candidatus Bipolaricaulota bacterium]|nr:acetyl-CoA decarbonylase/synthase complex subunit gamma [Candidatus Bipolaricaulota bacterium]